MSKQNLRPVRIGIVSNSEEVKETLLVEQQYIISNEVYDEMSEVLINHGAEVKQIEAKGNLYETFARLPEEVDLIFNLAQDLYQVSVPMVIEQLKFEEDDWLPEYTGARFEGHTLALNKALARQVLGDKIPQPAFWYLENASSPLPETLPFPVIVKPVQEAHSIGIRQSNVVYSMEALKGVLAEIRSRIGRGILIETFLDGNEYSMGIIGNLIMPAADWNLDELPGSPLVRGEDLKQQDLTIPHAKLVRDPALSLELARQVATVFTELGLLDYSRCDFRARKSASTPCFLEVNSGCGLRNLQSVLPFTAATAGVSYEELIASIAAQALQRTPEALRAQLDTSQFEATYQGLQTRAKAGRKITVKGQDFYIMDPLD